ncbi:hypothetical protein BDN72DRAFT_904734 [Pluteus cervinus]|uniref:Uncharacterized protein n=1 Tax=Pluteus cervinus TaxID=181527 RepID=A0ACD3A4V8_9AGAR|nr:hypothetical protein BDN72DRAFT_904734 [Pluteus cervinus]
MTSKGPIQDLVRRQLAEQDKKDMDDGAAFILNDEYSASELISVGLELEDNQRRLSTEQSRSSSNATNDQKTRLQVQANNLQRKIDNWVKAQKPYIPTATILRRNTPSPTPVHEIPLFLPSSIISQAACSKRLREIEWQLRFAQAGDALNELRNQLRVRSFLYKYRDQFERGQRANTRSQGLIDRVEVKSNAATQKYRAARNALISLSHFLTKDNWTTTYPPLHDEDIRGLVINAKAKVGEGFRAVSWIWGSFGNGNQLLDDAGMHESVRVEWCKARARSLRWAEEVELVKEEMRRVIEFLSWESARWAAHAQTLAGSTDTPELLEGQYSYALKQSRMHQDLKDYFEYMWDGNVIQSKEDGSGEAADEDEDEDCEVSEEPDNSYFSDDEL